MAKKTLSVITYNIHKGFSTGNRRFVLKQIQKHLVAEDADLLFLQELQGEHQSHQEKIQDWPDRCQSEFLAENNWPHYAYGKNVTYSAGHHGNAILSKFALETWENINVSPFSWASRSILHGIVKVPTLETRLHMVCVHFGLTSIERKRQIQSLCQRIDEHIPGNEPLIVAGDFNDWLGQAEKQFHEHLNLQEAFLTLHGVHAKSFPSWLPIMPMDRIYFRGLKVIECSRLGPSPWHELSDHTPLMAIFELP